MSSSFARSRLGRCLTAIPICGGFCAETPSPEQSWLRHFSNEKTLPLPCLRSYLCRRFWEHNIIARTIGRLGFSKAKQIRGKIMLTAFIFSFIAWILTLSSFFGLSYKPDIIRSFYWAHGSVDTDDDIKTEIYVGIRNLLYETRNASNYVMNQIEWKSADVCLDFATDVSKNDDSIEIEEACADCREAAIEAQRYIILSILTQIFTMTTDLQRMTPYGDVNCQKVLGIATGIYSFFSTLMSMNVFRKDCWLNLPKQFNFHFGPGFILLFIATVLKIVDVLCHVMVPVPAPKALPAETNLKLDDYLMRCSENTHFGAELSSTTSTANPIARCSRPATSRRSLLHRLEMGNLSSHD